MARAISDEELQLKKRARRRLIGAVILVTIVVVALPMVLDTEPKSETQDINIRIPATDAGTFAPKVAAPAPAPAEKPEAKAETKAEAKPESKTGASAPAQAAAPAAAPKPNAPAAAKAEKPAAAPQAAAKAPPKAADAGGAKDFVVQVIALSDADRAKKMQQQIAAAGIKSYTEIVKTEKGDVTRVRAGPFPNREAAEKVRGQLKGMGLDGKVIPR